MNDGTSAEQYSITTAGAGAVTLDGLLGQTSLNLSLAGTSTVSVTVGSILVAGATTLNLASNGSFATTPNTIGTTVTLPDNGTLKVTGSESLTVTGAVLAASPPTPVAGETVDASAFKGKLTVNEAFGNSKVAFTTGTGGSSIIAQDTGTAQINNFTLGTGADKLSFLANSSQIGTVGTGTTGTVTAFDTAHDSFVLGFVPTALDSSSGAGTGVLLTDLQTIIGAAGITAGHADLATITSGTDAGTWLVSSGGVHAPIEQDHGN